MRSTDTRVGVVVQETWTFFDAIHAELASAFPTRVFEPRTVASPVMGARLDRWLLARDLDAFLDEHDVVFFEWVGRYLAHASRRPRRARVVARLHSHELLSMADHVDWRHVDHVVLISRAMEARFLARYPAGRGRTSVVYHGVPLDTFRPVSRPFRGRIGMLCRLVPPKRVYEMILALHALRNAGLDLELHVAGGRHQDRVYARDQLAVQELPAKLGIADHVRFHGEVEDPHAWLQEIDIFVSHSYWEGYQVALMEAMASGCYCLAHFWDGVDEILPAEHVYVGEDELRAKITAFCALKPAARDAMGARLRRLAEQRCDIARTVRQIRELVVAEALELEAV